MYFKAQTILAATLLASSAIAAPVSGDQSKGCKSKASGGPNQHQVAPTGAPSQSGAPSMPSGMPSGPPSDMSQPSGMPSDMSMPSGGPSSMSKPSGAPSDASAPSGAPTDASAPSGSPSSLDASNTGPSSASATDAPADPSSSASPSSSSDSADASSTPASSDSSDKSTSGGVGGGLPIMISLSAVTKEVQYSAGSCGGSVYHEGEWDGTTPLMAASSSIMAAGGAGVSQDNTQCFRKMRVTSNLNGKTAVIQIADTNAADNSDIPKETFAELGGEPGGTMFSATYEWV